MYASPKAANALSVRICVRLLYSFRKGFAILSLGIFESS